MIQTLAELDTQIFLALNGLHTPLLDPIMKVLTGKVLWIPMYVAIAAVLLWRFGLWRGLLLTAVIGAAVGLSDMVSAQLIRPAVERLRPANLDNPLSAMVHIVDGYRAGGYSFPSCHAANTAALAMSSAIILRSRPYTIFICLWALLQCYTRIYLGVHYPFDILVGAIIGSAFGLAAIIPARRLGSPHAPQAHAAWLPVAVGTATILAAIGTQLA